MRGTRRSQKRWDAVPASGSGWFRGLALAVACAVLCPGAARAQVGRTLVTPSASPAAQKVYGLLVDLENGSRAGNRRTIIGQHCEAQKEIHQEGSYAGAYYDKVTQASGGKKPAFVEFDLGPGWYQSSFSEDATAWRATFNGVGFLKDRWTYGDGLVGLGFHQPYPGSPVKSFENTLVETATNASGQRVNLDDAWFKRVVDWQNNTAEYQTLLRDLSWAANRLQPLKDAGVPVLFRPYHEMNKRSGRFWWANRDPALYKQLWSIIFNYMTKTRGFNNLIWVWSPYAWDGTYGGDPWNYYPTEGADIVAVDIYSGNPYLPGRYYTELAGYNKPRMLAENDKMPVRWDKNVSEIDARPWVIYSIWGDTVIRDVSGSGAANAWNVENNYQAIKNTYAYEKVLTGGQLPPGGTANYNWWSVH
ncbi:glycosyl hydrolase [Cystobacter fuscus]|uniref:glycosyl hydrolase n=1 Tax=Cystobacter fuscus TaxID=43 RepID=UPI002B2F18DA|nr:mannanase [Cystobacter fuscus]